MSDLSSPLARPYAGGSGPLGVLLLHGFTGTPAHMRPLGDALVAAGHRVRIPLLPGHGTSLSDMNRTGWRDWLAAAKSEYSLLRSECALTAVCGLSMGGILALILAEEYVLDGVITISAPLYLRKPLSRLAPLLAPVMPYARWSRAQVKKKSGEKYRDDFLREYSIGYSGVPTGRVRDLTHLTFLAHRDLYAVSAPILVVSSGKDETVSAVSARRILSGVSSRVRQELLLPNSRHVSPIGPDRALLTARVIGFLSDIQKEAQTP